jgi:hypothetical protein
MSTQVQYRRGTATQNNSFVGALGEITVDTTNWTLRVHNGATAGGAGNLATVAYVSAQIASLSSNSISDGTSNVRVLNNGNVLVSSGGTPNVAVISSTGLFVTGLASVTGAITGAGITGTSLSVSTGNITGGNLLLTGAITDSNQLDIQTSANNANIVITPNGTGNLNIVRMSASGNITASTYFGTIGTAAQTSITSLGTLSSLSVTGNIDGGNLRTAGLVSATGAITGAAITGTSLTVSTGSVTCGSIVNANANGVGNIGSATTYFNTVFAKATSAQYADVAEKYRADANYPVGTVLVFGGDQEVTISQQSHSSAIAGTISENPAYIMNNGLDSSYVAVVALLGRVPCRVIGNISKGDLLVSSDIPGVATRLDPTRYQPGSVIGKALKNYIGETEGVIEIVVGRM